LACDLRNNSAKPFQLHPSPYTMTSVPNACQSPDIKVVIQTAPSDADYSIHHTHTHTHTHTHIHIHTHTSTAPKGRTQSGRYRHHFRPASRDVPHPKHNSTTAK